MILMHCAAQVALGRKMSEEDVRKVAKGRAWTGRDALEHGLVDALGGLQLAITLAKLEAGLPLEVRTHELGLPTPCKGFAVQAI